MNCAYKKKFLCAYVFRVERVRQALRARGEGSILLCEGSFFYVFPPPLCLLLHPFFFWAVSLRNPDGRRRRQIFLLEHFQLKLSRDFVFSSSGWLRTWSWSIVSCYDGLLMSNITIACMSFIFFAKWVWTPASSSD